MNFQQLSYIIAVEEFKNFNRAALACDVAQSTLSKEIQRLEKEHDIVIFDRTRNPVVPTLKGIDLINKAKEILLLKKDFVQIAKKKKNEVSGYMTLAITEILAPYIAPLFLNNLANKYPNLELKILELSDRRIEDLLGSEEVDAAIMISPDLSHDYFERKLFKEEILLYSTEEIKQFNNSYVDINQLDFNAMFIHEDLKVILKRQIKSFFDKSNLNSKNNIKYLKGNLETIRNIIFLNGGRMLIPKMALPYLSSGSKKHFTYPFTSNTPKLDVSLISTRGFEKNRIIKRLITELLSTASI